MKKVFTLAIVKVGDQILLGMKKRKLGKGLWNGFGGKVESGETIEEALARECEEEAGITISQFEKRGVLTFHHSKALLGAHVHEAHVFEVQKFSGDPRETEEMNPRWFLVQDIPYDQMWADDKEWLPMLLEGKNFKGEFRFDVEKNLVMSSLRPVL